MPVLALSLAPSNPSENRAKGTGKHTTPHAELRHRHHPPLGVSFNWSKLEPHRVSLDNDDAATATPIARPFMAPSTPSAATEEVEEAVEIEMVKAEKSAKKGPKKLAKFLKGRWEKSFTKPSESPSLPPVVGTTSRWQCISNNVRVRVRVRVRARVRACE